MSWWQCNHGAATSHLASTMQATCATLHLQPKENFNTVLLARTHGEQCFCGQRKLSKSLSPCSELGRPFLALETPVFHCDDWAFVSGLYPQIQDSPVIIVFMKFVLFISTWQQISGYCRASLLLLDCHQFWDKFH